MRCPSDVARFLYLRQAVKILKRLYATIYVTIESARCELIELTTRLAGRFYAKYPAHDAGNRINVEEDYTARGRHRPKRDEIGSRLYLIFI